MIVYKFQHCNVHTSYFILVRNGVRMFGAVPPTKLDAIIPPVADFPARHIGPRKHDARSVVQYLCILVVYTY